MKIIAATIIITLIALPFYKKLLLIFGSVDYNYKKNLIPISFGGFILLIETIILLISDSSTAKNSLIYWLAFLLITLVGTYDDLYGDKSIKGLKGHINSFLKGRITSGFIKAFIGGIVSILLAYYIADNPFSFFTHGILILLMLNTINLFDLRPGRALKVFFILYGILALSSSVLIENSLALIVPSILLVVFFQDVRAKIMIGDSASNLIGLHLGIWYSLYLTFFWQWVSIVLLVILHIYTEKKSLTKLIDNNQLLHRIDLLGRKGTT